MNDELSLRQLAIRRRLAGDRVEAICTSLQRSLSWFHKWWHRYLRMGPGGLYDLTKANHHVARSIPPQIERAVLSVRRRLAARATPQTRYGQVGAAAIRKELSTLGLTPLPSARTIARILKRAGLTNPSVRLAAALPKSEYPGPRARDSNHVHQVDGVGPRYLKGDKARYYFLVCKDVFDQAVYLELVKGRTMDTVLTFLIHAWQHLGLPEVVQFDNGREFCGFGRSARSLSRVIRLCLRLAVAPVFIPPGKPQHNGSVENFNGWFQPVLLKRTYRRPGDLRRQLKLLMTTVNEHHVHPQLGYKTPSQYRRTKRLRMLPANCSLDTQKLPICAGKITFIRLISTEGTIKILDQQFKIGKRLKFQYVKAILSTKKSCLKVYHKGRLVKQFEYELPKN
jgi:putative transposase